MNIKHVIAFVFGCLHSVQFCMAGDTTHEFKKHGFILDASSEPTLFCEKKFTQVTSEVVPSRPVGVACKNRVNSDVFIQVGWKDKSVTNTDLSLKVASEVIWLDTYEVKKFDLVCDNNTGIELTVGAMYYPSGEDFASRAFSCEAKVEGGKTFTILYYVFSIDKQSPLAYWVAISDAVKPGSATKEKLIEIAKGIKKLPVAK